MKKLTCKYKKNTVQHLAEFLIFWQQNGKVI